MITRMVGACDYPVYLISMSIVHHLIMDMYLYGVNIAMGSDSLVLTCANSVAMNVFFRPNLSEVKPKSKAPNMTPKLNTITEVSGKTFLEHTRSH